MKARIDVLIALLAVGSLASTARGQLSYTLKNLTTGSSYDQTAPYGINAAGHITGYGVVTKSNEIHAFIYTNGTFNDLGLFGYYSTIGRGINDSDQVAMTGEGASIDALLYANGSAKKIGNIDGNFSWCLGMNNNGDIVGGCRDDNNNIVGYSYIGGTFNDLSPLAVVFAYGINDSDLVVGSSLHWFRYLGVNVSCYHAFEYDGTTFTDLGYLYNGDSNTEAWGVNESGQIVGYSEGSDGFNHAFLYSGSTMQDLGTINGVGTEAVAINNAGLIVGNTVNVYGVNLDAFVDWNGQMWDFSKLITSGGSGWSSFTITGVNDRGSIVGTGTINGNVQGFVATLPDAKWSNYGAGFAGTTGVPGFTAESNPVLGSPLTLDLGNSLGATTSAFLLIGYSQASFVTGKGGTILVAPSLVVPLSIPAGGTTLTGTLPNDPTLAGFQVDLQAIELDTGAAKGLSFTQGLELDLGY